MDNLLTAVIVLIVVIMIYKFACSVYNKLQLENVKVSSGEFTVYKKFRDYRQAAHMLDKLNRDIIRFFKHLKDKYDINTEYNTEKDNLIQSVREYTSSDVGGMTENHKRQIVNMMLRNYNPEVIIENDPVTSKDTSYTVAKEKQLFVCLREKKGGYRLHKHNDVMFVMLHEIAHMGNRTWGHDAEYWRTFKFVLDEAVEFGIYTPVDYSKYPITYCGLYVNYNPYFT